MCAVLTLLLMAGLICSCGKTAGPEGGKNTGVPADSETDAPAGNETDAPEVTPAPATPVPPQTDLKLAITKEAATISREQGSFPTLPYYGWPSVAVDENDVTYVVVSKRLCHVDPYGKVMLYKSYDKGLTWDEGTCILDTILDDRDAGIVYMGGGRLLVTSFSHDSSQYIKNSNTSYTDWQAKVSAEEKQKVIDRWDAATADELTGCSSFIISTDYGRTWSERHLMPVTAPHGPTLLKDGSLMYLGVPKAPKFATGKNLGSGVYCFISTDGGETFEQRSKLKIDGSLGACEAYGIQLENGRILATVRTNSFHTMLFVSEDCGNSWSEAKDITYGAPAQLVQDANGVVVLSYARRGSPTGQCVRFSVDNGDNWSQEFFVSKPASSSDADLGYPATAQYSDGTFITVYYQKWQSDATPSLMRTLWEIRA